MNKRAFLKSDWFLGGVIALILAVAAHGDLIQSLERKAYDLGVNAVSRTPSDKIAVIAIDDRSISNIGRWPWPRDVHARMTDALAAAQAKVIVNSTFFFEPQIDPGFVHINKLLDLYAKSVPQPHPDAAVPAPGVAPTVPDAKAMSETVMLGAGGGHPGGTVILPGGGMEKPMLGRYQVEKELGKGAMGIVYLGKDPKIGRVVAIKTMALSQEFEPDELKDVKERFFREAETAGRLNHPNIVTIFDAGEEHDLAYIAMEFLKGGDLAPYTKPGSLLPLPVLSIIARVAEALGYAHRNNVVHR